MCRSKLITKQKKLILRSVVEQKFVDTSAKLKVRHCKVFFSKRPDLSRNRTNVLSNITFRITQANIFKICNGIVSYIFDPYEEDLRDTRSLRTGGNCCPAPPAKSTYPPIKSIFSTFPNKKYSQIVYCWASANVSEQFQNSTNNTQTAFWNTHGDESRHVAKKYNDYHFTQLLFIFEQRIRTRTILPEAKITRCE